MIFLLPFWGYGKTVNSEHDQLISKRNASVPAECLGFAMNESFPKIAVGERSRFFVKCSSEKSLPEPGQPRPRYKDTEIKNLTLAFEAVTDCLEIEPQWLFPKLMMESGFHVQIQNPNGDAGVGQLTAKAIQDVDQVLPTYKSLIFQSKRKSCQWIKNSTQYRSHFWRPVLGESKCALMNKQSNPLRNLLYAAIFHKLNEQYVESEFIKRQIPSLLKEAGFPMNETGRLKKILVTLGYNTGGSVAVKNLQEFLFSRIDFIRRKSQEFNSEIMRKINPSDLNKSLAYVSAKDFDFSVGLAEFNRKKQQMRQQLQEGNRQLSDAEAEQAVQRVLRNVSVSLYTFPEWLKVWQSHGGPGYVSGIATMAVRLDKKFGPGVCANSENYRISESN